MEGEKEREGREGEEIYIYRERNEKRERGRRKGGRE